MNLVDLRLEIGLIACHATRSLLIFKLESIDFPILRILFTIDLMPTSIPFYQSKDPAFNYETLKFRREDRRFYASKAWRSLRRAFLLDHPLCDDCQSLGLIVPAVQVHHKIPRKANPALALEWTNLQALCVRCHNAKRS